MNIQIKEVIAPNHKFTRFPLAITIAIEWIEQYANDENYYDEGDSSRIKEFCKDMWIWLSVSTYYVPDHLEMNGGKLYRQKPNFLVEINEKNLPVR